MELELNSMDGRKEIVQSRVFRYVFYGFLALLINSGYLLAFWGPDVFYVANTLLHVVLGIALLLPLFTHVRYYLKTDAELGKTFGMTVGRMGYFALLIAFATGYYLLYKGKGGTPRQLLILHIGTGFFAFMCLISSLRRAAYNISVENTYWRAGRLGLTAFVISGLMPILSLMLMSVYKNPDHRIVNPKFPPGSLADMIGEREEGVFYPSPAETDAGGTIPTGFLDDAASCARAGCHVEELAQWQTSAHSKPAFGKPWYQRTFAFVQQKAGDRSGNYCAACHSPSALFSGLTASPVASHDSSAALFSGITCTGCHAVEKVKSGLGDGGYVIDKPAMHWLTTAREPILQKVHDLMLHLDPEPHRRLFSKPFHQKQPSAFCSSCHKMTLDDPLPSPAAIPGMYEYDSWYGSTFTKRDVRGFFHLNTESSCTDCHMPYLASSESEADGQSGSRDHSFKSGMPGSAPPDRPRTEQMPEFELDLFAKSTLAQASPATADSGANGNGDYHDEPETEWVLPLQQENAYFLLGSRVRVELVLKILGYGHAFPAGSPGVVQSWIELEARDRSGRLIYSSTPLDDAGYLRSDAHKYGVFYTNERGERIYGAHGVGSAAIEYANLVPPNAVDLTSHEFVIPPDCGDRLVVSASLKYRKLSAAAAANGASSDGTGDTELPIDASLRAVAPFTGIPVRTLVEKQATVKVLAEKLPFRPAPSEHVDAYLQWNDYGLGLLRQGRVQDAMVAFYAAVGRRPDYHDGYVNLARGWLLLAQADSAISAIERAEKIDKENPKAQFFKALGLKMRGDLRAARLILKAVRERFHRDRAVSTELAHVYMLEGSFEFAGKALRDVVRFAPDDPVAHFYLMHVYQKLDLPEKAAFEEKLYHRFSRKFTNEQIVPQLDARDPLRDWQVLPWANYFTLARPPQP